MALSWREYLVLRPDLQITLSKDTPCGYRLLEPGEAVQPGDMYTRDWGHRWIQVPAFSLPDHETAVAFATAWPVARQIPEARISG